MSTHDLQASQKAYEKLEADPNKPLLNRPLVSTPPPGSTFKLVTTAAALESGRFTPSTVVPGPASYRLPQTSVNLKNWQGTACRTRRQDHFDERAGSQLQQRVRLARQPAGRTRSGHKAEKFGFNKELHRPHALGCQQVPTGLDAAQTAMSAIGQFDVTASTLQMAMVGAAIGNNGITMNPYLVKEIRGADLQDCPDGVTITVRNCDESLNAKAELNMMVDVVENGTGSKRTNWWHKGWWQDRYSGNRSGTSGRGMVRSRCPTDNPKVAVAVCIENAGGKSEISGNGLRAPIAKSVIEAVLNNQ